MTTHDKPAVPDVELKRWRAPADDEPGQLPAGATRADAAKGAVSPEPRGIHAPHARPAETPLDPGAKHDHMANKSENAENRQEALIDEGIEETFPASDPVSVKRIT